MKNKNVLFNLAVVSIIITATLISCEEEINPLDFSPEDVDILINDSSVFNMSKFIASYEKISVIPNTGEYSFSHDYESGKAIRTYKSMESHGDIGNNYYTVKHEYNADGVIISSSKVNNDGTLSGQPYSYQYDKNGYIISMKYTRDGAITEGFYYTYNDSSQIINRKRVEIYSDIAGSGELFTYSGDGYVTSYEKLDLIHDPLRRYEFKYSNGKVIEKKEYLDGNLRYAYDYKYDSEGRLINAKKLYHDYHSEGYNTVEAYEYEPGLMVKTNYRNDEIYSKYEYGPGLILKKSYETPFGDFNTWVVSEKDEYGMNKKNSICSGTIDSLTVIGYSIIEERDRDMHYIKTRESFYEDSGELIVSVKYYPGEEYYNPETRKIESKREWFDADGNLLDQDYYPSENWIVLFMTEIH